MAFWALGAFDKVKNITEKLNIKDVSKKVISYVAAQTEPREEMEPIGAKSSFDEEDLQYKPDKPVLSDKERMEIQLREYKKLVRLQEEILQNHRKRQISRLAQKEAILQQQNIELIQEQQRQRKEEMKGSLIKQIQSGERSVQDVISENIQIKQKIIMATK